VDRFEKPQDDLPKCGGMEGEGANCIFLGDFQYYACQTRCGEKCRSPPYLFNKEVDKGPRAGFLPYEEKACGLRQKKQFCRMRYIGDHCSPTEHYEWTELQKFWDKTYKMRPLNGENMANGQVAVAKEESPNLWQSSSSTPVAHDLNVQFAAIYIAICGALSICFLYFLCCFCGFVFGYSLSDKLREDANHAMDWKKKGRRHYVERIGHRV